MTTIPRQQIIAIIRKWYKYHGYPHAAEAVEDIIRLRRSDPEELLAILVPNKTQ